MEGLWCVNCVPDNGSWYKESLPLKGTYRLSEETHTCAQRRMSERKRGGVMGRKLSDGDSGCVRSRILGAGKAGVGSAWRDPWGTTRVDTLQGAVQEEVGTKG